METIELENSLDSHIAKLNQYKGAVSNINNRMSAISKELNDIYLKSDSLAKALEVLQALAELKRHEIKGKIEALVTKALRSVFNRPDYSFEFKMELKRANMTAMPVLKSKFGEQIIETDIVDGHGGGIVDVCSFVLQVIILLLSPDKPNRVFIGDESFKHV